jgi:hypothetical protein
MTEQAIWRGVIAFGLSVVFAPGAFAQKINIEFDEAVNFSKFK